jgi:hypothetical protein
VHANQGLASSGRVGEDPKANEPNIVSPIDTGHPGWMYPRPIHQFKCQKVQLEPNKVIQPYLNIPEGSSEPTSNITAVKMQKKSSRVVYEKEKNETDQDPPLHQASQNEPKEVYQTTSNVPS